MAISPPLAAEAARLAALDGPGQLEAALTGPLAGQIALVSSFGAESAVLLHLVSQIDPATPVIFLNTLKLFPETLAYRDALAARLGLTNIQSHQPGDISAHDPDGTLWSRDPDSCCFLRKVVPLDAALAPFAGWINGRKRYQLQGRATVPTAELDGPHLKLTPLAHWTAQDIAGHMKAHALPAHPLVARGFASIGCAPCTAPGTADDPRSGRWAGAPKSECGIHTRPKASA
ncbi:MAG: phosphoadenylyl-sulfate reductase [Polymorphobacter sp.]|uniref:phosphoadenylyl-sulfate reductase n=1 Tax=Polymorphobacter sp. TaxID=1909290 RepID=UPI003A85B01F